MKTKEELKEEIETLNKKLAELSEDELKTVSGGGMQMSPEAKPVELPVDHRD